MEVLHRLKVYLLEILLLSILFVQSRADTNPLDVISVEDLYKALERPPQLKGWKISGGDPCGESWEGIGCSGSSIIHIKLHGLGLGGCLGGQLLNLHSLKHLDISSNNIHGEIPFLPPNATHVNLAFNKFTQNIPSSLTSMKNLRLLNLSHNMLSGPVGNFFTGLQNLREMDLSHNNFTGDLPSSFASLKNLTTLFLQNNSFTGSVIFLADLQLTDLNIQDNKFSGIIPEHFQTIPNLWIGGNKFHGESNYHPWEFPFDNVPSEQNITSPPTSESNAVETYTLPKVHRHKKKGLGPGGITLMVGGVALVTTFAAVIKVIQTNLARKKPESIEGSPCLMQSVPASSTKGYSSGAPDDSPQTLDNDSPPKILGSLPHFHHITKDRTSRRSFSRKFKMPPSARLYSVAEVQLATNNFSEVNFLGEGSLGSVYKAEFPDGQMYAVKNINTVALSLHEEEQFMDVIHQASRLRHPNIVRLTGYCVERGQHLLLYEYVRNLSLDDALYCECSAPLTWGLRLQIAVGVSQALNYMHSLSPPIAHCNLKASNILLDDEFMPRLCDCGLAILRPLTSNSVKLKASEMAIINSGYIAPEHGQPGVESTKADVYAFGVLLLELLTGRRPLDSSRPREEQSLAKWASSQLHDADALELMVDPSINRSLNTRALSRFADVVSLCIQPEKEFRPPISEIVEALTCLLPKPGMDGSESGDPFEKSFRSIHTRFAGSPTVRHVAV